MTKKVTRTKQQKHISTAIFCASLAAFVIIFLIGLFKSVAWGFGLNCLMFIGFCIALSINKLHVYLRALIHSMIEALLLAILFGIILFA